MTAAEFLKRIEGRLIASCQAAEGDAFRSPESMRRFAQATLAGGAVGIRASSPQDIAAIRAITDAPIIGIEKVTASDGRTLITPDFKSARALYAAGATCIALDLTVRGQRYGALDLLRQIKHQLNIPVLADIATVDEGVTAAQAGADFILSTLRGYTAETAAISRFEPDFVRQLCAACTRPVIAEGRIHSVEEARLAIQSGASAVIIGTAITRPRDLTARFAHAIETQYALHRGRRYFVGVDLGGTNTKFGVVSSDGRLLLEDYHPTPARSGRAELLAHLKATVIHMLERAAIAGLTISGVGIASAGWIDAQTGSVAYATENLPGWTGTPIAVELRTVTAVPVSVENDANALAVAEKHFGAGRPYRDFACITLGTGVGGGCYSRGELNRGAHYFANALGHLRIVPDGLTCSCGQRGCLEMYANSAALLRYAAPHFNRPEQIIEAANAGDARAILALTTLSGYLAQGCVLIVQMLDPEAIIFSGGLAQNNPLLRRQLQAELSAIVPTWSQRKVSILASPLGYHGGVLGGAAIAIEKFYEDMQA